MIFGNEGLPRSGKSLDAMQHIVDSIHAGRVVVTNIHGLSYEAISDYCSIPLPSLRRLLITVVPPAAMDEEQKVSYVKAEFLKCQFPDCLWIWDEINQFWPPERQPLPAEWAKFITEHGHLGIDILIMGQDLSELHTTWRKRLQRYTRFTKLDMLGKDDHFHWRSLTNIGKNKYRATAEGKKPYPTKFFPLYKSHRDETTNKGNYKDARFGVFQTKHKVFAAIFCVVLCAAIYNAVSFFKSHEPVAEVHPSSDSEPEPVSAHVPVSSHAPDPAVASSDVAEHVVQKREPIDYLDKFASQYELRLGAILDRSSPQPGQAAFEFVLDFVDPAYRIKERMHRADVASLGWAIERHPYGIRISKGDVAYVARPWPLDNFGKVPQQTIQSLKPPL